MNSLSGIWRQDYIGSSKAYGMSMKHYSISSGPDNPGTWSDSKTNLTLSVSTCSSSNLRLMHSPCNRYTLAYSGDIYNHLALRRELSTEGRVIDWHGASDTETLLVSLCHWGVVRCTKKLNGPFIFALWDASEQALFIARDHMGNKPIYYGYSGEAFVFGSEIRALVSNPSWKNEIDRNALALYLRYQNIPAPYSIYKNIKKLPPAHFVVINNEGKSISDPKCYWEINESIEQNFKNKGRKTEPLVDNLEALLLDSISLRAGKNTPIATFLSGGYDSSLITTLTQAQSSRPISTITIGFNEDDFNEATHARTIAKYLGTDHAELYVTSKQAAAIIPSLPNIYDEPFSDPSQIPTYLACLLAKKHTDTVLSGDGGDELFGGYNRHVVGPGSWSKIAPLPYPLRKLTGKLIGYLAQNNLQNLMYFLPDIKQIPNISNKLGKLSQALTASDEIEFYRSLTSRWNDPSSLVLDAQEPDSLLTHTSSFPDSLSLREQMMYLDQKTYLPDVILTKLNRASMAAGLRARVPLLDYRLVEFSWQVPAKYKVRDGQGKWLLRQVLYRHVPKEIIDRPKMGFDVPIEHWLRGPLRDWAEELLSERRLREEGYFNPTPIRRMWQEHTSRKRQWHYQLWSILMFQAWLDEWYSPHR